MHPANQKALEHWLESAEEVLATRDQDLAALEEMKKNALPMDPNAPAERAERVGLDALVRRRRGVIRYYARLLERVDRGEVVLSEGKNRAWVAEQVTGNRGALELDLLREPSHRTFRFADDQDQILFDALTQLVSEQEKMLGTERPFGLVDLARWGLAAVRRIERLSLDRARSEWEYARRSIADRGACPQYDGLELKPQLGLVPIGRDPASGLWEFAHVSTGDVPVRGPDGRLQIDEDSAIVLVLIPGGTLWRGSQREAPSARNFDPWSESNAPLDDEEVELVPFFLSKYELTRAQWQRVTGRSPGEHVNYPSDWPETPLQPFDKVTFDDARRFLLVLGLALPTEAQWEWAQRAGTSTPWSCGAKPETIAGYANVADLAGVRGGFMYDSATAPLPALDDGFAVTAPVGSLRPNAFGMHDMMGNVREWCRDVGPFEYRRGETRIETGERVYDDDGTRAARGGSFRLSVLCCRSAARDQRGPALRVDDLGMRPARDIDW